MTKAKLDSSSNWDKAAERLWLRYEFWRPSDFAENHGISVRSVRHYLELGMPSHGTPHKGSGGLRLAKSAVAWLHAYRYSTANGARRFSGMSQDFLEYQSSLVADESMAYAKLYGGPWPRDADAELDEYLSPRDAARERKSWKTGFRELRKPS